MDTVRYRAFLLAAEAGSIRSAAEIMGYTSSAVSQLIRTLETELDVKLLIRGKNGVRPTGSGKQLIPIMRNILSEEERLRETAAGIRDITMGTINVAAYSSLSSSWLPDIIQTFQSQYPAVRINLFAGTQEMIAARLISGEADIVFFNDSMMTEKHDWIPLMEDPLVAVVPAGHPMAEEKAFPVSAFAGERFIMPEHGYDYDIMHILREAGVTPNITLSTFDSHVQLAMVEKGMGVGIANSIALASRRWTGKIRALPLVPAYSLQMGIAVRSLKSASPAVRKFIECAKERQKDFRMLPEKL